MTCFMYIFHSFFRGTSNRSCAYSEKASHAAGSATKCVTSTGQFVVAAAADRRPRCPLFDLGQSRPAGARPARVGPAASSTRRYVCLVAVGKRYHGDGRCDDNDQAVRTSTSTYATTTMAATIMNISRMMLRMPIPLRIIRPVSGSLFLGPTYIIFYLLTEPVNDRKNYSAFRRAMYAKFYSMIIT